MGMSRKYVSSENGNDCFRYVMRDKSSQLHILQCNCTVPREPVTNIAFFQHTRLKEYGQICEKRKQQIRIITWK